MARVNIDECALSDPRFDVLASLMGVADADFARGRMIRIWMQCANRETYVLSEEIISAIFKTDGAGELLVRAQLAQKVQDGFRIRGTKGRTDYLKRKRATARQNGKLGGRKRKPTLVPDRLPQETPLTLALPLALPLAPAPALSPPQEEEAARENSPPPISESLIGDSISRHEAGFVGMPFPEDFEALRRAHPEKSPARAEIEWKRTATTSAIVDQIKTSHAAWMATQRWRDGVGIPTLANFLSNGYWKERPEPAKEKPNASDKRHCDGRKYRYREGDEG